MPPVKTIHAQDRAYLRGEQGACPPVGRWPKIMVTTDANEMHQNVAFPEIKFQNSRSVSQEFPGFNRLLSFV